MASQFPDQLKSSLDEELVQLVQGACTVCRTRPSDSGWAALVLGHISRTNRATGVGLHGAVGKPPSAVAVLVAWQLIW